MRRNSGRALIEYAMLIIIIMTALFWMRGPIVRSFFGRWKATGDSFAFGRQYDPKGTLSCAHTPDGFTSTQRWYDERCFDAQRAACDTAANTIACEDGLMSACAANCPEANNNSYFE